MTLRLPATASGRSQALLLPRFSHQGVEQEQDREAKPQTEAEP